MILVLRKKQNVENGVDLSVNKLEVDLDKWDIKNPRELRDELGAWVY